VADDRWDGRGLPPVARARVERAARDGVRTSLLSAAGAAGLRAAGFEVVGEVLGAAVMQASWRRYRGCVMGWMGDEPYADAVRLGWRRAFDRLRQEATALGADGVVGVTLTRERLEGEKQEFTALGTAVRSRGRERPPVPFTTDLDGPGLVKLLAGGWVPAGVVAGLSVAVVHDDWLIGLQRRGYEGGVEIGGYTRLVNQVRAAARRDLVEQVARLGADGALMTATRLQVRRHEPRGHVDHSAECLIVGNGIVRFGRSSVVAPAVPAVILSDPGVPGWRRRGMTER
jgi:uncharacterized protein YbjQ (UPF0145 family)